MTAVVGRCESRLLMQMTQSNGDPLFFLFTVQNFSHPSSFATTTMCDPVEEHNCALTVGVCGCVRIFAEP